MKLWFQKDEHHILGGKGLEKHNVYVKNMNKSKPLMDGEDGHTIKRRPTYWICGKYVKFDSLLVICFFVMGHFCHGIVKVCII
jgi:hypothetical protein